MSGELDRLLKEAAGPRRITLTITNPTANEEKRLRQQARTVNSHKAPGVSRAKVTEG